MNREKVVEHKRMGPSWLATRQQALASGGNVAVPIKAAHGERSTPPDVVAAIGNGDIEEGHKICAELVKKSRQQDIKTLKSLPGPSEG